jgi:hypothetical protein
MEYKQSERWCTTSVAMDGTGIGSGGDGREFIVASTMREISGLGASTYKLLKCRSVVPATALSSRKPHASSNPLKQFHVFLNSSFRHYNKAW